MFHYTVTEENYLTMARYLLRKKRDSGLFPLGRLLLKTVVQMGLVAWLVIAQGDGVETGLKAVLIASSAIWALLSLFQYFCLDLRARQMLAQSKRDPQAADFWKEHRLSLKGDRLELRFGATVLELPCPQLTAFEKAEDLTLILRGKDIFELVPETVTSRRDWPAFEAEAIRLVTAEKIKERDRLRDELLTGGYAVWLPLSEEDVTDALVRCKRQSYLYKEGWSVLAVFTLAFPLFLGLLSAAGGQWPYLALCLLAFVLFNLRLFLVFLPAYRGMVRPTVLPPGEEGYLLAVRDGSIYLLTKTQAFQYPVSALRRIVRKNGELLLFFPKQNLFFVPPEAADGFLRAVKGKKSLREKAASVAAPPPEEEDGEEAP